MLDKKHAVLLVKKYLKDPDNLKFGIAVGAVLKNIAKIVEKNEDLWELTGILHNLDYEYCSGSPENRGNLTAQLLDGLIPENGINAIKSNNYMHTDYIPTTSLDKALIATVSATGLIFSIIQMTPSKKAEDITLNLLLVKYQDENFAKRYNRSRIRLCKDIGMDEKFYLSICLNSIKEISGIIGF